MARKTPIQIEAEAEAETEVETEEENYASIYTPLAEDNQEEEVGYMASQLFVIGEAAEKLDAFTQHRIFADMARSAISAIGWNRAFEETILYGDANNALALQDSDRDETGLFIGVEPGESPTDINGHVKTSIWERLTEKQLELLDSLEEKEINLWEYYRVVEEAWRDSTGEKGSAVKPTGPQKKAGLRTLEDLVEDAKRGALRYKVDQGNGEAADKSSNTAKLFKAKMAMRAKMRAERNKPIR